MFLLAICVNSKKISQVMNHDQIKHHIFPMIVDFRFTQFPLYESVYCVWNLMKTILNVLILIDKNRYLVGHR